MQRHVPRHLTAYTITALVYFFIVTMFYYSQTHRFVSSEKPKESVIEMSLSEFVPEVIVPPKKIIQKSKVLPKVEPKVEKKLEKEPEPIKEEVTKKVTAEPVIRKEIIKKIVEKKKVKKPIVKNTVIKKTVKKKQTNKRVRKKVSSKKVASTKASSKQSKSSSKAEKNKFWNALRTKIDKHKFYPRIAKKRRMEGTVKVSFTVLSSGNVSNISVQGPKVFHKSAKNAVKSAFPINVKRSPVTFPTSINITLNYQVR